MQNQIDYEEMVQSALRSVVKEVLLSTSKKGLPAAHHFYIAFSPQHPGVDLPDYLRDQYPDEITIVLQHEFWDLVVEETRFSVTLCFNNIHERLTVPFTSITSFVDPTVKFGLQFSPSFDDDEGDSTPQDSHKEIIPTDTKGEGESNVVKLDIFRKK